MPDHAPQTEFAAELTRLGLAERVAAFSHRDNISGLRQLAVHCSAILLVMLVIAWTDIWWVYPVLMPLLGILLVFLFAPLHETVHRSAFASLVLNKWVGVLCGLVIALPPTYFRCFHIAHHRHTQIPEHDPELQIAKPATWGQYLYHVSGLGYWRAQCRTIWGYARTPKHCGQSPESFVPARLLPGVIVEARVFLGIYTAIALASVLAGSGLVLIYWVIPVLIGQPFLRLFLLAEHTLRPVSKDMFANTRTTLTHPLIQRLVWNMNFHTEHHVFPSVPFHALPEVHKEIARYIQCMTPGYRRFHKELQTTFP